MNYRRRKPKTRQPEKQTSLTVLETQRTNKQTKYNRWRTRGSRRTQRMNAAGKDQRCKTGTWKCPKKTQGWPRKRMLTRRCRRLGNSNRRSKVARAGTQQVQYQAMQNKLEPRTLNKGQWHSKTDLENSVPKLLKSWELREYYFCYEQNHRSYGIGRLAKNVKPIFCHLVQRKCQRQESSNLFNGKETIETVITDRKKRNTT